MEKGVGRFSVYTRRNRIAYVFIIGLEMRSCLLGSARPSAPRELIQ
jgi:hypothetical protein